MDSRSSGDLDSGIRVVVTPSQSSYFAGEPFSVTITFTNTRSPEFLPVRTASYTHKRGAHSISSAPLARPPTSPGTPRTPVPAIPTHANNGGASIARKGLIGKGKGIEEVPGVLEQSRKKLFAKSRSLSVTVAPHEVPQEPKAESLSYVRAYDEVICKYPSSQSCYWHFNPFNSPNIDNPTIDNNCTPRAVCIWSIADITTQPSSRAKAVCI